MKKFYVKKVKMKRVSILLFLLCVLFAAPALAANPFVDVPVSHWAYDAVGQLAARGILSGFPDGSYKGRQPVTRYEMASALARALALADVEKADRQDTELLKRLVAEFKDELDALGVKVDELDNQAAALGDRLGGWRISGELHLDAADWEHGDDSMDGSVFFDLARLEFHRWFGEDGGHYFYVSIEEGDGTLDFAEFFVDIPFAWDSSLTAGRFTRDFEGDYRFQTGGATDISNESWMSDRTVDGFAFSKSFALGSLNLYAARPLLPAPVLGEELDIWELHTFANFQFTERFGADFGAQLLLGDDASVVTDGTDDYKINDLWTLYGGLRFNFTQDIALKGIFHHQDASMETGPAGAGAWQEVNTDSADAWKVILDVRQDLLKFTSLWLEYGQMDRGFFMPYGNTALTLVDDEAWNAYDGGAGFLENDAKIWRVGAAQRWNDKWSTWIYAAGHTLDGAPDYKGTQWGVGAEYQYNESVAFALNYIDMNWNGDANSVGYTDNHRILFRTSVAF